MKKYNLIFCMLGSAVLSFAINGVVHAEDRPRAARADAPKTQENHGQPAQNKEASKPSPPTDKATTTTGNRVHMGPTTVTVIDDGEAIDDVVSRVRQARIDRLRQAEPKNEPKDRHFDRNPEDRRRREPASRLDRKVDGRSDKAATRGERLDEVSDKREERLERIKERREQRTQMDHPVRGGRSEK